MPLPLVCRPSAIADRLGPYGHARRKLVGFRRPLPSGKAKVLVLASSDLTFPERSVS